jgi:signal transduction histidine kinase/CheY-like chemotaxis protein
VEEALDWSIEDVLPLQSLGALFDTVSNSHHSVTETEGLKFPQIFEVAQSRKDGKILWCEVLVDFLRGRDGQIDGLLGVSRDITARREVEHDRASLKAQLQQSQKMEAIGRMAGGISHDFNNLLTSILVSAQLLLKEETQGGTFRRDILEIKEAADRATDLTRQLLAFSRNQVISPKVLDVNATLKASLRMVERLIHEDIHFEFKPGTKTPLTTSLDPIQLEQVLVNLVVNSRDAMPDGGKIIVETELKSLSDSQCRPILGLKPGNYISLRVTDSGHGMNEATKARLFEPFFTTKPPGKGTGLGLSTVYGIVKQNSGFIHVESRVGRGTSVEIFFPQVEQEPRILPFQAEKPIEKTHGQRVLIVEDQPMVRNVARRILERNGFEVLEATNGREALSLGEHKKEKPDLLLTDVVMPEVGGRALADSLRERHPSLRVLFMSGYTEDHLETTDLEAPFTGFIQKPFTVNALLGAVQELLNQPAAP